MNTEKIECAAKAMAELYVWDVIIEILEGSPQPAIYHSDAQKIIKICIKNRRRCLDAYDKHVRDLSEKQQPEGER